MSADKRDWAREQMDATDHPRIISGSVFNLLNAWWVSRHKPEDNKLVIELFTKLALDQPLDAPGAEDEKWLPAGATTLGVGDPVRVRADAYTGDAGRVHNGRRGRIIAIRYGDILLKYDGTDDPRFNGVRHAPQSLEKRVS